MLAFLPSVCLYGFYFINTSTTGYLVMELDCRGLSTLGVFLCLSLFLITMYYTGDQNNVSTYCICHLYCLDCICREVLFSHLECKFLKGITVYDTSWYLFHWTTSGWKASKFNLLATRVGLWWVVGVFWRGSEQGPLLQRPPWSHFFSQADPVSCSHGITYSLWLAIALGIQRCTRKVQAKQKPKLL